MSVYNYAREGNERLSVKGRVNEVDVRNLIARLERIANWIERENPDVEVETEIAQAEMDCARLRHGEGLHLLNRLSLVHYARHREEPSRYQVVEEALDNVEPLDPVQDSAAIRALAKELRAAFMGA
jgi:hypothetical protein